jgi:hypothetical protein
MTASKYGKIPRKRQRHEGNGWAMGVGFELRANGDNRKVNLKLERWRIGF